MIFALFFKININSNVRRNKMLLHWILHSLNYILTWLEVRAHSATSPLSRRSWRILLPCSLLRINLQSVCIDFHCEQHALLSHFLFTKSSKIFLNIPKINHFHFRISTVFNIGIEFSIKTRNLNQETTITSLQK